MALGISGGGVRTTGSPPLDQGKFIKIRIFLWRFSKTTPELSLGIISLYLNYILGKAFCHLLISFQSQFSKKEIRNAICLSIKLDMASWHQRHEKMSDLILVKFVCRSYQQTTPDDKELYMYVSAMKSHQ